MGMATVLCWVIVGRTSSVTNFGELAAITTAFSCLQTMGSHWVELALTAYPCGSSQGFFHAVVWYVGKEETSSY